MNMNLVRSIDSALKERGRTGTVHFRAARGAPPHRAPSPRCTVESVHLRCTVCGHRWTPWRSCSCSRLLLSVTVWPQVYFLLDTMGWVPGQGADMPKAAALISALQSAEFGYSGRVGRSATHTHTVHSLPTHVCISSRPFDALC